MRFEGALREGEKGHRNEEGEGARGLKKDGRKRESVRREAKWEEGGAGFGRQST